ncbi:MAG TPA: glycosyltransferase family 4 protein [Candidatus Angelobacter sp.]|nr:glycosyltransferase family 4 protein [Candidatus Angelobacter sp.]
MPQEAAVSPGQRKFRIPVCLLCDTVGVDAGTERLVVETARRLDHTKFEVHVCCLEDSPQLRSLDGICQTEVFPTDEIDSVRGFRQVRAFRRYASRHNIQVVQAFMNRSSILAVLAAFGTRQVVITSRLNTGYWYTPKWRTFFRILNLGTTRILTNSLAGRDIVMNAENLAATKIDVLYQGVNAEHFNPGLGNPTVCTQLGIAEHVAVVGIVANLRPVKDIPLFLRAAKVVLEACPETAFLVVGQGEMLGELRALAGDLGIRNNVFFTRGEGQVIDYLARMSIGCLTSFSEGFSNAILEYMAVGLPVVATDVGGNREAVADGETGLLVRERSPEAFAQPIIELLHNNELRERMGEAALQRCLRKFEFGKTIRDLENYYSGLVQ